MSGDDNDADYEVSYGRPPREHRFKKGESGNPNPKGRPKGAKNTRSLIRKILEERVTASVDGKDRRISKREALYRKTFQDAMNGNNPARKVVLEWAKQLDPEITHRYVIQAPRLMTEEEWLESTKDVREKYSNPNPPDNPKPT